jgi:hypothetical protein
MPSPSTRIRVREVPTRNQPPQRRYPQQDDWLNEPQPQKKRYIQPEKPKSNRKLFIIGLIVFLQAIFFFFFRDLMPVQVLRDYMDIYGPVVAGIGAFLIIRSMPRKVKKNNHKMQFRRR